MQRCFVSRENVRSMRRPWPRSSSGAHSAQIFQDEASAFAPAQLRLPGAQRMAHMAS